MLVGICALYTHLSEAQIADKPTGIKISDVRVNTFTMDNMQSIQDTGSDIEPATVNTNTEEHLESAVRLLLQPCPRVEGDFQGLIAYQVCQHIRMEPSRIRLRVEDYNLRQIEYLGSFYSRRNYQPAWLSSGGKPLPATDELIKALGEAESEGLRPSDYGCIQLQKLQSAVKQNSVLADTKQLVEFDLLFTDSFLTYASHLLSGRVPPHKIDHDWAIKPRSRDLAKILQDTLAGKSTISESLHALAPKGRGYVQLREILHKYRRVEQQGGWPIVREAVRPGSRGIQVTNLSTRLYASGDLITPEAGKSIVVYDKALTEAVRRFQKRHGLTETGVVNLSTLRALNISVSQRIRQVELNMERWRWLPDEFGSRYIMVNIPSFKMNVVENDKPVMEARVVVGRQERQTPTFTANMAYLVMSPKWYVPRSIAVKDKLPQLKRNPYALTGQNIRVYNSAGQQIDPGQVNWKGVSEGNFNYQLRQDAGPHNALGGIKFMFPNPYNVYLHDTPSRGLFSQSQRTFSSGCIRISNPVELAEYLLKHDPKWNRQTIKAAAVSGKQRIVNLPQQVPVFLLYWTAWIDENGWLNFRDDIYNRDKPMVRALYQEIGISDGN
jgi:murein L,D-transpeptidase YcbB/YkuD